MSQSASARGTIPELSSVFRGCAFKRDGSFDVFVTVIEEEHRRRGYWLFGRREDEPRAHQYGHECPEDLILAQARDDGDYSDIQLRWIPGTEDSFHHTRRGTAAQHLENMADERKFLGLSCSFDTAKPGYPVDTENRLLEYRKRKYGVQTTPGATSYASASWGAHSSPSNAADDFTVKLTASGQTPQQEDQIEQDVRKARNVAASQQLQQVLGEVEQSNRRSTQQTDKKAGYSTAVLPHQNRYIKLSRSSSGEDDARSGGASGQPSSPASKSTKFLKECHVPLADRRSSDLLPSTDKNSENSEPSQTQSQASLESQSPAYSMLAPLNRETQNCGLSQVSPEGQLSSDSQPLMNLEVKHSELALDPFENHPSGSRPPANKKTEESKPSEKHDAPQTADRPKCGECGGSSQHKPDCNIGKVDFKDIEELAALDWEDIVNAPDAFDKSEKPNPAPLLVPKDEDAATRTQNRADMIRSLGSDDHDPAMNNLSDEQLLFLWLLRAPPGTDCSALNKYRESDDDDGRIRRWSDNSADWPEGAMDMDQAREMREAMARNEEAVVDDDEDKELGEGDRKESEHGEFIEPDFGKMDVDM